MWLKAEVFVDSVRQCWSSSHFQGYQSFILARKLKELKAYLRVWNKQAFVMWRPIQRFYWMNCVFLMAWRRRELLCDEEKLRKNKVISDMERASYWRR